MRKRFEYLFQVLAAAAQLACTHARSTGTARKPLLLHIAAVLVVGLLVAGCADQEPEPPSMGSGRPASGGEAAAPASREFLDKDEPYGTLPPPPPIVK
jgi:hypothetical protein